jgi:hypothetical protein
LASHPPSTGPRSWRTMSGGTGLKAAPQPGFMTLPRACPRSLRPVARIRRLRKLGKCPGLPGEPLGRICRQVRA